MVWIQHYCNTFDKTTLTCLDKLLLKRTKQLTKTDIFIIYIETSLMCKKQCLCREWCRRTIMCFCACALNRRQGVELAGTSRDGEVHTLAHTELAVVLWRSRAEWIVCEDIQRCVSHTNHIMFNYVTLRRCHIDVVTSHHVALLTSHDGKSDFIHFNILH